MKVRVNPNVVGVTPPPLGVAPFSMAVLPAHTVIDKNEPAGQRLGASPPVTAVSQAHNSP